jgi:AraC-like DNA-binding protein
MIRAQAKKLTLNREAVRQPTDHDLRRADGVLEPPILSKIGSLSTAGYRNRAPFQAGPFHLRFEVCPPHQEVASEYDSSGEILIVAEGSVTQILDAGPRLCGPLSVSYRGPGYPKRDKIGEAGLLALRIGVQAAFAYRVEKDYFAGHLGPKHYPFGVLDDAPARVVNECAQVDASPLLVDGLLRVLIAKAAQSERGACRGLGRPPSWLAEGIQLIEGSFGEPLRIENVARAVGVEPAHFSRVFHRYRGMSAKRFLSSLRLRHGASMLANTSIPVSEIAFCLGFCDQAHFTRHFKRWADKPPEAFRRDNRPAP